MSQITQPVTGLDAYTKCDHGLIDQPTTQDDRGDWVAASRTRNWCQQDPLLDWLNLFGDVAGFERDPEPDPRTDFGAFVFRQGHAFEAAVAQHLDSLEAVCRMDGSLAWLRSMEA